MLDRTSAGPVLAAEPPPDEAVAPAAGPRLGGLVLTRRLDESIVIAGEVEVRVVGIRADAVRLKITAPRSIPVHRREVSEAIRTAPRPSAEPPRDHGKRGGLVLTRRVGQKVTIGDDVEVEVSGVHARAVRLRVVAPRSVAVHRREVHEAIRQGPAEG